MPYVALHNHTDGSVLDGSSNIKKLVKRAKELGMTALGITDHGNMINALVFQEECLNNNINPVLGCEFYMGESESKDKFHIILIAKDQTGLKNLFELNAFAYTENFYSKPRITWEQLRLHHEGLICTTACLGGELAQNFFKSKPAIDFILSYEDLFGDDFYLELQANSIPEQTRYNEYIKKMSEGYDIRCIVTTDSHYVNKEDSDVHDTMLCMQTKKKKHDDARFRFSTNDFYIKSELEIKDELIGLGFAFMFESMVNTIRLASKCTARIDTTKQYLPKLPGVENANKELALHCNAGYTRRFAFKDQEVVDRIKYELKVIREKGYSDYFLIVEDFINWAKQNGIYVGGGRGSGCGSEVAYVLGITEIEPLRYGLLFERFLNPERMSQPDIDSDFCYERRGEVIEYVKNKYGKKHVCNIIAKGRLTAKAVCRKVLTAYDFDQRLINQVSKTIPDNVGITLSEAYSNSDEFAAYMDTNASQYRDMLELEGCIDHVSKHAAGMVICPEPVASIIPCMSDSEDRTMLMSQWDKKEVEKMNLYKFDFLGLKTLTVLKKTIEHIKNTKGIDVYLNDISLEDRRLYDTLNSGMLGGIFQFNAPSGEKIIKDIHPECFEDVIAGEALCRPGVKERDIYIRNKRLVGSGQPLEYEMEVIKEILEPTYGAIVYQEQTMLLMNRMAGWSLGKADKMRKVKDLEEYRIDFVDSCIANCVDGGIANSIYNRFSLEYSFNKSHAVAYAVLTMQTAWLKTYYPEEFMAATLTLELTSGEPAFEVLIKECMQLHVNVLPPDINLSTNEFFPTEGGILFPLNLVKQVGDKTYFEILAHRPYENLEDFCLHVAKKNCNSRHVKNLIKAGCFGSIMEINRAMMLHYLDEDVHDVWDKELCREYELETLGMMLTEHPLKDSIGINWSEVEEDETIRLTGLIKDLKPVRDKHDNEMCFLRIELSNTFIPGVMFSSNFERYKNKMCAGMHTSFIGKKNRDSFIIDKILRA